MTTQTPTTLDISVDLTYTVDTRTEMLLQIEAACVPVQTLHSNSLELVGAENIVHGTAEAGIGRRTRFAVTQQLNCTYHAMVEINRAPSALNGLEHSDLTALPNETLRYLMPSRYCVPADFAPTTEDIFGTLAGGAFIDAVRDWVCESFAYAPGTSTSDTTAADTFLHRAGICRDFAHVVIAMARARGIPARFVACYAPDVTPQDFHAVAEVWLADRWHLVDATGMADASEIARIGVGMDAAEVAFLTVFGVATLLNQQVTVTRRER